MLAKPITFKATFFFISLAHKCAMTISRLLASQSLKTGTTQWIKFKLIHYFLQLIRSVPMPRLGSLVFLCSGKRLKPFFQLSSNPTQILIPTTRTPMSTVALYSDFLHFFFIVFLDRFNAYVHIVSH